MGSDLTFSRLVVVPLPKEEVGFLIKSNAFPKKVLFLAFDMTKMPPCQVVRLNKMQKTGLEKLVR